MKSDHDTRATVGRMSDAEWHAHLDELGEESGYFEPLGTSHSAFFSDAGPVLLVSFETRRIIRARQHDQLPLGHTIAHDRGWSSLTLIADMDSWFRDAAVYAYFDRLVDDAFFEDFDRVVFYGAGMAGYAAAAFSVTAPGATVIALQPQATLDPRIAGWDRRQMRMRRTSFNDRYGFAPDMMDGAAEGFVIYDPNEMQDAMHAALFARPYVTRLACPNLGPDVEPMLAEMGILEPILRLACEGRLDAAAFWRLYRARRDTPRYLRQIVTRLEQTDRPFLDALLCRNAAERLNAPRFRARLAQLEDDLRARGVLLPPARCPRG